MHGKYVYDLLTTHGELVIRVDSMDLQIHLHNTTYDPSVDVLIVDTGTGKYWIFGHAIQTVSIHKKIKEGPSLLLNNTE
ncbi:MAG: hypothetical protein QW336_02870 [Candidatus Anstonellales archaeon]